MIKWKRKAFRGVGLLFPATLYGFGRYGAAVTLAVLTLFLAILISLEISRFRYPGVNRWLFRHFQDYTKDKERARVSATTLYLSACWLVVLLFPAPIAVAAMTFLLVGDPAAELVGTRWGRVPLLGKSLEGTLAGLLACTAAGFLLLLLPGLALDAKTVLGGAAAATCMELAPVPVDDNFTVPLFSATVMHLVWVLL